jgi:pilus assembly protein CpaB
MGIPRGLVFLLLSFIISAIAVFGVVQWSNRQLQKKTETYTQIVVASTDLDPGTKLTPELVKVVQWPSNAPVPGSFSNLAQLTDRVVYTRIWQGEPVVEKELAPLGSKAGLSSVIPAGYRAITVRVNEIAGVAGFTLPGNYVDLLVNLPDDKNLPISKIVLQKVLVLAVAQDQEVKDDVHAKVVNAVTLQVTPEQSEKVDLARNVGSLTLVLRNQVDPASVETAGVRKTDVLAGTGAAAQPALPSAPHKPIVTRIRQEQAKTIEIVRGTSVSSLSLR